MEDPSQSKVDSESKEIGGTWKEAIKAAYEATRSAFPGGEILAHLDQKWVSYKEYFKCNSTCHLHVKTCEINSILVIIGNLNNEIENNV